MTGRGWIGLGLVASAVACRPMHGSRLIWEGAGSSGARTAAEMALALPLAAPGMHAGTWGASQDATYQLLEVEVAEAPHAHQDHDLTVVILRGQGTIFVADRRYEIGPGDIVHVGRGRPHHFHPAGGEAVLGLGIFTPRLESRDFQLLGE